MVFVVDEVGCPRSDLDSDGDGLEDALETSGTSEIGDTGVFVTTDPCKKDTDGDNLNDGVEVNNYGTDPLDWDTDDDGIVDILDIVSMINIIISSEYYMVADMNNDGVIDILDIVLLVNSIFGN